MDGAQYSFCTHMCLLVFAFDYLYIYMCNCVCIFLVGCVSQWFPRLICVPLFPSFLSFTFLFNNRWNGTLVQAVPRIEAKDLEEVLAPQLQTLPATQVAVLAEVADLAVRCVDSQVGPRLSFSPFRPHRYSLVYSRILSHDPWVHGSLDVDCHPSHLSLCGRKTIMCERR